VLFEGRFRLERIKERAFLQSGLTSIVLPPWIVVLLRQSFHDCKWLVLVIFESDSRLEQIEELAFCGCGLKSIKIPSSGLMLGRASF
jgi:hypothetical protein